MTTTVHLTHSYPYPARQVWKVTTDLDHLETVTAGLLAFRDLPSETIYRGQHIKVQVSLFGKLPYQPYEMTVTDFDDDNMTFRSNEVGAGVKSWRHSLAVLAQDGGGARIDEQIEVNAGWLTPIFAAWARFMYRKRHAPRLQILERKALQSKK